VRPLRRLWRSHRIDDIDDELRTHLDMAVRDRIERGMPPDEARADAIREFGNVALVAQTTREVWSWTTIEQLLQDLRFGARILTHAPAFSVTAIVLIALVIGGNTTIYSIVNGLLVSPAPGVTAERLVAIKHVAPGAFIADPFVSYPNYLDYARLAKSVEQLAGWSDERLTIRTDSGNYAVFGALVTSNFFETFGVAMTHGRSLRRADDERGQSVVAIISHRLWRERFDQAADIVGRTLHINNVPATIVGVSAPEFAGVLINPREDVWVPIAAFRHANGTAEALNDRTRVSVVMVGRRAPQASMRSVRAEFEALSAQLQVAFPNAITTLGARGVVAVANPAVDVRPYSVAGLLPMGDMAPRFLALFSIVTLLTLLVVSANVANLMLGRSIDRQRDTAVRRSLGASRMRVLRMLVAEGLVIAVVAWAASCAMAWWTARLVMRVLEPSLATANVRPDWTLAAYAMALAAVATMTFSGAPAARAWKLQVLPLLRSGEQSVTRGRSRLSNTLVVLQLAFSVLLLTSAGLAYRSLAMLDSGNVGFDPEPMLLARLRSIEEVNGGEPNAAARHEELAKLERVRDHLARIDRVRAVSYSRRVPGAYFLGTTPAQTQEGDRTAQMFLRPVGPNYLASLGLTPVAGRDLSALDRRGSPRTAVINAQLAHELFPGASALGRTVLIGEQHTPVEIVGVAPNALFDGPVHDPNPRYVFVPLQQSAEGGFALLDISFFVRYEGSLDAMTPVVNRAVAATEPTLPIVSMSTMRSRLNEVTVLERQVTTMLIGFALTSLLVAALGQYAAAMFNMRRRTRDFGVRMALGASSEHIRRSVVQEAFLLTVPGLLIGFLLSAGTASAARAALFGVTAVDPLTYLGVMALLAATSFVASYLPAWRAGRVNVVDALRQE
jgi:predicted permease